MLTHTYVIISNAVAFCSLIWLLYCFFKHTFFQGMINTLYSTGRYQMAPVELQVGEKSVKANVILVDTEPVNAELTVNLVFANQC